MAPSLSDNRTLHILNAAAAGKYGVLAAIAYNIEQLTAIVRAAEAKRSPLIIQLFPSTLKQLPTLAHAAAAAVNSATIPLSLHIDHAQDEAHIREMMETLPVDSIMVDMSHFDQAENLEKTRILAKECHERGIAVEAESGRINGGEDGIADTGDLEALFTAPSDVEDFINASIDILAPSIGNIHGDYGPSGPAQGQLHFDRLESINKQINDRVQIALHGTNDFPPQVMQRCIRSGAIKLNVNKLILEVWNVFLRENASKMGIVGLIDEGMNVLQKETERWMDICGSSGKA
ncbi:fructose-bisphosphate aldolase [Pleomassaria siparia CBS 279.74]|uniref:Fructose-bisphosphate aldolase n=1 Tax=Pleomassaria siparia CBS 279.74 TaxID=1314801 RepID=A0A6G1KMB3_9PLEO|nr:fructose-bisphosphate aldolase [Pleomassaria siparia CBS 279.74]